MARIRAMVLPVAMLALTQISGAAHAAYSYPPVGPDYVLPAYMNRVGQILNQIDNPTRRSEVAESWLDFAKTAISKNLEFQQQWIDLQKQQLAQNQQASQDQLQLTQLQLQIEQLRAKNLQLQKENLQMQMELNRQTRGQKPSGTAPQEPNQPGR